MFYLATFIFIALMSFLDIQDRYKALRREISFLVLIFLFFIAAFRYETGIDWLQYTNDFKEIQKLNAVKLSDVFSQLNFGYFLLCIFVKKTGGNIQLVFFIMQLIVSVFLWKTIKEHTELRILSLLLYFSLLFFHMDLNLMKQAAAVSIFMYSLRFIIRKSLLKYFLFILLAFSFHWSAILFFPLYFILNKHYSTTLVTVLFVFFVLFNLFQIKTGNLVYNLSVFIFGESAEITEKTAFYTSSQVFSVGRVLSLGFIANILIMSATLFYRKKLESLITNFDIFFNLMLLQLFFYFAMYEYIELSGRLRFYTLISSIIILPYFVKVFSLLADKIIVYLLIVAYCFSYVRIYMENNISTTSYNPYQNYIIHTVFDKPSNGAERVYKYQKYFEKERKKKNK